MISGDVQRAFCEFVDAYYNAVAPIRPGIVIEGKRYPTAVIFNELKNCTDCMPDIIGDYLTHMLQEMDDDTGGERQFTLTNLSYAAGARAMDALLAD